MLPLPDWYLSFFILYIKPLRVPISYDCGKTLSYMGKMLTNSCTQ